MFKKKKYILLLITLFILFFVYRVYIINKNVPTEFSIEYFHKKEVIKCENINIKILSSKIGDAKNNNITPITIEAEIKNKNDHVTTDGALFIETMLGINNYTSQTNEGNFDMNNLKKMKPHQSTKIKLVYQVNDFALENKSKNLILYLPTKLYNNEAHDKYNQGIRYAKAIKL
ncbi:hypothetical protein [Bacillus spizizenii]|uniref:DUF4352 domain-containing protein n=1 Tax=Bacillus spizizenii (strain DSM 15029 / JCM 12233 / NBRC 101239 / NRRL B-23049 / TU-B-10) TaxID=1052585 RepID=G4P1E6_BACS4|nr:hypothetical protein [Bacillus spizizenii]AEP88475.1 hypothetical protein GYO_3904 [Bacillus spizizenii TU-B-10]MCI4167735.1 hypothetical protein [Bacillus spizizenii]GEK24795.1 hypothetical protein BSU04nite_11840 [Bacillus spizizenii]